MLDSIFTGLFDSSMTTVIPVSSFLLCVAVSLVIGIILAASYMIKSSYTKSFIVTLALLPAVVCVVIMMVNGNIGAGVAVAGAFSLIRFRSVAGKARDIVAVFIGMGAGLIAGMGYLAYAALFTIVLCVFMVIYTVTGFGKKNMKRAEKTLTVTIPEDLDYTDVFEDLFNEYTTECDLVKVKTSNMGSLYKLKYDLTLKDASKEKELLDKIRCRNGNLEISMSVREERNNEL
ncbi:MAG: DUF4956 domain-containing protein [Lachnospiraceae bacterium]|nr:DUF4956 domain-containing protein [Lachnospiraceae bacterium]